MNAASLSVLGHRRQVKNIYWVYSYVHDKDLCVLEFERISPSVHVFFMIIHMLSYPEGEIPQLFLIGSPFVTSSCNLWQR